MDELFGMRVEVESEELEVKGGISGWILGF